MYMYDVCVFIAVYNDGHFAFGCLFLLGFRLLFRFLIGFLFLCAWFALFDGQLLAREVLDDASCVDVSHDADGRTKSISIDTEVRVRILGVRYPCVCLCVCVCERERVSE